MPLRQLKQQLKNSRGFILDFDGSGIGNLLSGSNSTGARLMGGVFRINETAKKVQ
ncbi:MAG: hypothetical protein CM15mP129_08670 [Chloroflexota bacterium]|nr:MAG: hypothetical protein CM15mP129_08670 [Chloroflexota bacterium]